MANTYEYKVINTQRDASGIVVAVAFSVSASDGTDSFTHNYHTALPAPKSEVIPFADLTEDVVIAWVKALVQEDTEKQADAQLEAYKIRKEVINELPWGG